MPAVRPKATVSTTEPTRAERPAPPRPAWTSDTTQPARWASTTTTAASRPFSTKCTTVSYPVMRV
ncbi:hypothetical protein ASG05_15170 [Frigoribacterium sp. Leaf186]|nr:hypothetical protein ASG05_15170 [Frigoribacterium sp. Leaf186]